MRVESTLLPDLEIARLTVTNTTGAAVHEGTVVGYLCMECWQLDESLGQLYHRADCQYAGEHGRQHYDSMTPTQSGSGGSCREFDPEHEIHLIRMGEHDRHRGIYQGDIVGFLCQSCGNADEDLFEVRHDEDCALAGKYEHVTRERPRLRAD